MFIYIFSLIKYFALSKMTNVKRILYGFAAWIDRTSFWTAAITKKIEITKNKYIESW